MKYDICDSAVSLKSETTLAEWNGMVRAFLAHGTQTPEHLGNVLSAEPDFAMGHAAKGLFCLMLGRVEMIDVARDSGLRALENLRNGQASNREKLWVRALGEWLAGRPSGAIAAMEDILTENPRDTLTAKVSHAIRFILGDHLGMRSSIERVLDAHGSDHALRGYVLGCHAFTLEETGEYDAAEQAGLLGLQYAPDDAWGLHAVAHVFDMTARPDQGIQLIENNRTAWESCNNFRYHVWWHKALLHLDRGELDLTLNLYDTQIRADKTDDYRDISNATSLLMRLELEGVNVGARWQELADFSEARSTDGCLVFADLHYMLALGAAGRKDASNGMTGRYAIQATKPGEMPARIKDPGVAAMVGLEAFSEGRYDDAFANLCAARPTMQTVGGSHAQRDVFERITIDAGIRAGRFDQAEALLADRMERRGGNEDRFASTRFQSLAETRRIPAQ